MESLVTRKCQIYQKKDVVKQLHSLIVVWTCLGHSSLEREGPVLNDILRYLPVLQVEQYLSR